MIRRLIGTAAMYAFGLTAAVFCAAAIVKSPTVAVGTVLITAVILGSAWSARRAARLVPDGPLLRLNAPEPATGDGRPAPPVWTRRDIGLSILGAWRLFLPPEYRLPTILGDLAGVPKWLDLASAPHLLIGGSTGSGKSTFLHSLIVSTTALARPERLRLVLIDPKRVELNRYRALPHLAAYASETGDARRILGQVEMEMDRRYRDMDAAGVRDVSDTDAPRVLVVIDEFADLVLTTRKTPLEVEGVLSRLLALGRAAGVHVVLATQRPDARVVTGLIKANAPVRVAFQVASAINSRIILDARGAEALRGAGDGLVVCPQIRNEAKPGEPVRFQGYRISDADIDAYVLG